MKKLLILMGFITITFSSQACEICGCGVGNFYLGMMPRYNNQFIGLRYRYMSFTSTPHDDHSEYSHDTYRSMELWGGMKLGKKWQAMAFVPYQMNQRITNEKSTTSNGLGDITLLFNYRLLNSAIAKGNQQLWLGGGAKLPTGKYKIDFTNPENNLGDPNAQAGSGSVDFLANINHNLSLGKWGLNTTANYKVNTTNTSNFKFGNRFTVSSLAYHRFQAKSVGITPVLGGLYENASANRFEKSEVEMTGGYALFASSGLELSLKKVALGFNAQLPLSQNFSMNQTQAKSRGLIHLTFTL